MDDTKMIGTFDLGVYFLDIKKEKGKLVYDLTTKVPHDGKYITMSTKSDIDKTQAQGLVKILQKFIDAT